jgi:hypothetical protein
MRLHSTHPREIAVKTTSQTRVPGNQRGPASYAIGAALVTLGAAGVVLRAASGGIERELITTVRQAETPPIVLFRFPGPALSVRPVSPHMYKNGCGLAQLRPITQR